MTITAFPARNEYTATAGQTLFTYTFKIYASTDLNVYVTPSGQDANDATDIVTGYSVTGLGDEDGGTITLVAAVSVGDLVTIVSDIPENRTTDYQNNGDFLPGTVNADFDRVVSLTKQEADRSGRTLSFQESLQGVSELTLPDPEALKYVRWKADESGQENVDLASFGSPTTASLVTYNQGGTGAIDRTVESRLQDSVYVEDFAISPGIDNTLQIQRAVDFAETVGSGDYGVGTEVIFKAKEYDVSAAINIKKSGVSLRGAGKTSTMIKNNGTNISTFRFALDSPELDNKIARFTISDMTILHNGTDPSSGSHIEFDRATQATIQGCILINHYRGVELKGTGESCRILDTDITQGSNTTGLQSGSCAVAIIRREVDATDPNAVQDATDSLYYTEPNSVYIDNTNFRSNNFGMANCVFINACDGVYATNSHWGFATGAILRNDPAQDNLGFTNIMMDNIFFDPLPGTTDYGILYPGSALDGSIASHKYSNCTIEGAAIDGINISLGVKRLKFSGGTIKNSSRHAINVSDGVRLRFTDNEIANNSTASSVASVLINGADNCVVLGNTIDQSYRGIQIGPLSNHTIADSNNISTTTNGSIYISDSPLNIRVSLSNVIVESTVVASTGIIDLPAGEKLFNITGTTTITNINNLAGVSSGTSSWENREVILKFNGVLTVVDGGNLSLAGDFVTVANSTLSLIYDGTKWLETSRNL